MTEKITYKDAGVDVELADRVIGSLKDRIKATFRPEVMGRMGGFAAMFRPDWQRYEDPVLVSATDGVGTKLKIAFLTGIHHTIGIDLVAMNVNDILVTAAEPLFFSRLFCDRDHRPRNGEVRDFRSGHRMRASRVRSHRWRNGRDAGLLWSRRVRSGGILCRHR